MAQAACDAGDFDVTGYARSPGPEHPAYEHVELDLSDAAALERFVFPQLKATYDQVVLVHNAGALGQVAHTGMLKPEAIAPAVQVNLTAPLLLSNAFVRDYGAYPASRLIVYVSTGAASSPYDGWSLYCSTKAGLDMLARVQEKEFALRAEAHPLLVRAIAPGVVETAMQQTLREADPRGFSAQSKFVTLQAEGRLSHPQRVGEAYLDIIRRLGRDQNSYPELISRIPPLA
jgi:benzil reductase ((S)-benzoin forming)